jgi:hypothetical protein
VLQVLADAAGTFADCHGARPGPARESQDALGSGWARNAAGAGAVAGLGCQSDTVTMALQAWNIVEGVRGTTAIMSRVSVRVVTVADARRRRRGLHRTTRKAPHDTAGARPGLGPLVRGNNSDRASGP